MVECLERWYNVYNLLMIFGCGCGIMRIGTERLRKDGAEQGKIGKFSFRMRERNIYDTFYCKRYL